MGVMKIGLDYHGVIDAVPEFFGLISQLLCEDGHEVHIITGAENTEELQKNLANAGMHWTHLFSISDYHKEKGTQMWRDEKGTPWMSADLWNMAKAKYCTEHEIDVHLDDTARYGEYFTTPFVLFQKRKP